MEFIHVYLAVYVAVYVAVHLATIYLWKKLQRIGSEAKTEKKRA